MNLSDWLFGKKRNEARKTIETALHPGESIIRGMAERAHANIAAGPPECPKCGQRKVEIVDWPSRGNDVPYEVRTVNDTESHPGVFKIQIWCFRCEDFTGYVVWDAWPGRPDLDPRRR